MQLPKISTTTILLEVQSVIWFLLQLIHSEAQGGEKKPFIPLMFSSLMNARHKTRRESFQYSRSDYWQVESTLQEQRISQVFLLSLHFYFFVSKCVSNIANGFS